MTWTTTISEPSPTTAAIVSTANGARRVMQASVCNPTDGAQTLTVYLVKSGSVAKAVYSDLSVAAGATTILGAVMNMGLDVGDEIHAQASVGGTLAVTITVSSL